MNPEIKQKREELKGLSQGFKILIKEGAINSVNEGLCQFLCRARTYNFKQLPQM